MIRLSLGNDPSDGVVAIDITEELRRRQEARFGRSREVFELLYARDEYFEELPQVFFPEDLETVNESD